MADMSILSMRLIEVRKINGYTRKRLAEELNRPYRTITNYETGEHEPGHKYLIEIAEKFGVTTDYLLGLSDDPRKTSDEIKNTPSTAKATPGEEPETDPLRSTLLHNFDQLNREGRERLVETSDDMVSSGKYIKSDPAGLGKAQEE